MTYLVDRLGDGKVIGEKFLDSDTDEEYAVHQILLNEEGDVCAVIEYDGTTGSMVRSLGELLYHLVPMAHR